MGRGVSVMEDEGQAADHTAGISSTDGAWHHIAVTWRSSDGATTIYDNGRKVSAAASTTPLQGDTRSKGKLFPLTAASQWWAQSLMTWPATCVHARCGRWSAARASACRPGGPC